MALRFTVDGREPLVATKGFMVQVPYRTQCRLAMNGFPFQAHMFEQD